MPLKKGQSVRSAAMGRLVDLAGGRDGTQKKAAPMAKKGPPPGYDVDAVNFKAKKTAEATPEGNVRHPVLENMRNKNKR